MACAFDQDDAVASRKAATAPTWDAFNDIEKARIKRIAFKMYRFPETKAVRLPPAREEFNIILEDDVTLQLTKALLTWPLRFGVSDKNPTTITWAPTLPLGKLTIATEEGDFVIEVNQRGFVLGETTEAPRVNRVFVSYGLAAMLDEILERHKQPRLPPNIFKMLSGEARTENDRRLVDDWKGRDKGSTSDFHGSSHEK